MIRFQKSKSAINDLLRVMADLRAPEGCPWDREQTHMTLRLHAIEEVYELMDAIEAGDDHEMVEELGDVLLQVVFHCQLAKERGAFAFEAVARTMVDKLLRRHPHVFGNAYAKTVDQVWAQWDQIKKAEKQGTKGERTSALDGVPKHLPALLRAEKLVKKARRARLLAAGKATRLSEKAVGERLYDLAEYAQTRGWSAEDLLRAELKRREKRWRSEESAGHRAAKHSSNPPKRRKAR